MQPSTEVRFDIEKVKAAIAEESKTPPLNPDQLAAAKSDLVIKYPKVKRHIVDPPFAANSKKQKYGMFSFYASRGAKPDVNGIYGTIILRGADKKVEDLERRAEFIIQNVDSRHEILIAEIGAEKPLSYEPKYALDVKIVEKNVDALKEEAVAEEKKDMERAKEQIENRKKALYEDVKKDPNEVNIDYYITQKVKMSNQRQHLEDLLNQVQKSREVIQKCRELIVSIDADHPEYKAEFLDKIKATFQERNILVDYDKMLKYMET
jgi:hypothetical protein